MLWSMVSGAAAGSGRAGVANRSEVGSTSGENTNCVAVSGLGCEASSASSAARRIAASTSWCSWSSVSCVAMPSSTRKRAKDLSPSRPDSDSRSALVRYLDSSSDIECE